MADPFIGQISIFAGNFAPRGWALCDGQLLPISSFTALFSLLGTTYGGDGRTTFALPDLRGRVAVGDGSGPGLTPRRVGERSGSQTVTLTAAQLPSHNHGLTMATTLPARSDNADQHSPSGGVLSIPTVQGNPGLSFYSAQAPDTSIDGAGVEGALTLGNTGGGASHENMQPFLALYYIIALVGTFPSRS